MRVNRGYVERQIHQMPYQRNVTTFSQMYTIQIGSSNCLLWVKRPIIFWACLISCCIVIRSSHEAPYIRFKPSKHHHKHDSAFNMSWSLSSSRAGKLQTLLLYLLHSLMLSDLQHEWLPYIQIYPCGALHKSLIKTWKINSGQQISRSAINYRPQRLVFVNISQEPCGIRWIKSAQAAIFRERLYV